MLFTGTATLEQRTARYFVPPEKVTRGRLINRQEVVREWSIEVPLRLVRYVAIKRFVVSRNLTEEDIVYGGAATSGICAADDLEHEIELMTELDHENILKCHGCFFDEDDFDPDAPTVNVILEWCGGGGFESLAGFMGLVCRFLRSWMSIFKWQRGCCLCTNPTLFVLIWDSKTFLSLLRSLMAMFNGFSKVCDFGLSNHFGSVISAVEAGKPRYIAPTRSGDRNKIDVYSFGILGYEIWLNGKHAYADLYREWGVGLSAADKLARIRSFHLRPDLEECFGLPAELKDLLTVCWSEDPGESGERPSFDRIVADMEEIIRNPVGDGEDGEDEEGQEGEEEAGEEEEEREEDSLSVQPVETWTIEIVSQHFASLFGAEVGLILFLRMESMGLASLSFLRVIYENCEFWILLFARAFWMNSFD